MTKNIDKLNVLPTNWDTVSKLTQTHTISIHEGIDVILNLFYQQKELDLKTGCFADEAEWQYMYNNIRSKVNESLVKHQMPYPSCTSGRAYPYQCVAEFKDLFLHKSDYLIKPSESIPTKLNVVNEEVNKLYNLISDLSNKTNELQNTNKDLTDRTNDLQIKNLDLTYKTNDLQNKNTELEKQYKLISELANRTATLELKTNALELKDTALENQFKTFDPLEGRLSTIESTLKTVYDAYIQIRDIFTCSAIRESNFPYVSESSSMIGETNINTEDL